MKTLRCLGTSLLAFAMLFSARGQTADTFNPGPNNAVGALALPADQRVMIGGSFTLISGQARSRCARLNTDGSLDTTINLAASGDVLSFVCLPDGRIVVGGQFVTFGSYHPRLARITTSNTVDAGFSPVFSGDVYAIAALDDGRLLVGGSFTNVSGIPRTNLAMLHADGSVDGTFTNNANGAVYSLVMQPDGPILAGGAFTSLGGQPRNRIARLLTDGSVDPLFNPGANAAVYCLAVQADGRILAGGSFSSLAGRTFSCIGSMYSDGSPDYTFNPGTASSGATVYSLAIQTDGQILVGGGFSQFSGGARVNLCRLNASGSLDTSFVANTDSGVNTVVRSLALQDNGRILAGGTFGTLAGVSRANLGRLSNTSLGTNYLAFDGSTITWLRDGTSPEVWRTVFEVSASGTDWTLAGQGSRIAGGWALGGLSLPPETMIRARGYVAGGRYNGSGWFVESRTHPVILAQPASRTNTPYSTASFSVLAGGNQPFGYQWFKNGMILTNGTGVTGAQGAALTLTGVLGTNSGSYHVVVSNAAGFATSVVATLMVLDPTVTTQPASRTNDPFTTATFNATGSGTAPLGYQWRKGANLLVDGGSVSGARTATLTLSNVLGADAANYSVIVSNTYGQATSSVAGLVVRDPILVTSPLPRVATPGSRVTFSASAAGTSPLACQWRRNGANLPGATDFDLVLPSAGWPDDGNYDAVFTNAWGAVTSSVARLSLSLAVAEDWPAQSVDYAVSALAVEPDGAVLLARDIAPNRLARLQTDGYFDTNFTPGVNGSVYSIFVQEDRKILFGGWFQYYTDSRTAIARVNPDGSLDSFNPGANSEVYSFVMQPDGKVIMGGSFSLLGGGARNDLGRVNTNGVLDYSFAPALNGSVYALARQEDGRLLLGGAFTQVEGQPRNFLARLNTNGTLDTSFVPGAMVDAPVFSLAVRPDGTIFVARNFTLQYGSFHYPLLLLNTNGSVRSALNNNAYVNSMALQADGKLVVGGNFTAWGPERSYLARLNADGSLDSTFNPTAGGAVEAVAIQADGKVLVGGDFGSMGGAGHGPLGRVNATEPATQTLACYGSTVTWLRGGTSPEIWRAAFDYSTDNITWVNLGNGTRVPGGWALGNVIVPTNCTLRARGFLNSGRYNGSSWFVETLQPYAARPLLVVGPPGTGYVSDRFLVQVVSTPNQPVVLETSSNLVHWSALRTNAVDSSGTNTFEDTDAPLFSRRFYRAR